MDTGDVDLTTLPPQDVQVELGSSLNHQHTSVDHRVRGKEGADGLTNANEKGDNDEPKVSVISQYWRDLGKPRRPIYRDTKFKGDPKEWDRLLAESTTLYVGNLSFYTTEEQILELFSRAGQVSRIIMGLDRIKKTPCGFCFVEYYTRAHAENAMAFLNGTYLDDREIRTDYDVGISEDRQFGRGKGGGQVRDDFRVEYDPGRGGNAKLLTIEKPLPPAPNLRNIELDGKRKRSPGRDTQEDINEWSARAVADSERQNKAQLLSDTHHNEARKRARVGDHSPPSLAAPEEGEIVEEGEIHRLDE